MRFVVKTKNLVKNYGLTKALDKLTFNIPENSVYGLLGPNGAGKSTTIGILSGLINKSSGEFFCPSKIGLLPQDASFYNHFKPLQQLIYLAMLQGFSKSEALVECNDLLKKVGLENDLNKKIGHFSHGMRRRLGIAQALIGNPELVILDEPTSGLDPKSAKQIRDLIKVLKKGKITIIFCSHNLYEVEEFCDYVGVLNKGKLVKEGKISDLSKKNVLSIKIKGLKEEIIYTIKNKSYVNEVKFEGDELSIVFKKLDMTNKILKILVSHDVVISKIKKGNSLEDIFMEIIGEAA